MHQPASGNTQCVSTDFTRPVIPYSKVNNQATRKQCNNPQRNCAQVNPPSTWLSLQPPPRHKRRDR